MKNIWIILLVLVTMSCASSYNIRVEEDVLVKTRIYAGKYVESYSTNDKYTFVVTTMGLFKLAENPEIPDSIFCYIRVQYPVWDFHPDIIEEMKAVYFTWNGSDKEYYVYNKIREIR